MFCIVLYCLVLFGIVLYCLVLFGIVWYCLVLFGIVLYCLVLFGIVWYCLVLFCIVWYCLVLFGIVLYCLVLFGIVLLLPWKIQWPWNFHNTCETLMVSVPPTFNRYLNVFSTCVTPILSPFDFLNYAFIKKPSRFAPTSWSRIIFFLPSIFSAISNPFSPRPFILLQWISFDEWN